MHGLHRRDLLWLDWCWLCYYVLACAGDRGVGRIENYCPADRVDEVVRQAKRNRPVKSLDATVASTNRVTLVVGGLVAGAPVCAVCTPGTYNDATGPRFAPWRLRECQSLNGGSNAGDWQTRRMRQIEN
jgi:hypothetical protein